MHLLFCQCGMPRQPHSIGLLATSSLTNYGHHTGAEEVKELRAFRDYKFVQLMSSMKCISHVSFAIRFNISKLSLCISSAYSTSSSSSDIVPNPLPFLSS